MTEFLKYLLESGIALVCFYLFYEIGLKRETCFSQNRVYLLFTPILALLLPLVKIPLYFYTENPQNTLFELSPSQIISMPAAGPGFNWQEIVIYGYLLVLILFLVRNAMQYFRLNKLLSKYQFEKQGDYYIVRSSEFETTFSFLNYIFWHSDETVKTQDAERILQHELIHVRQKHSYDIIYINFLCTLMWFNPVIWMYRKALENTHEYLADHSVIDSADKYSYIKLLVNQLFSDYGEEQVHYFSKSQTSRRIEMMKLKSYVTDKGRFLLMIPIALVLLVIFSFEIREMDITTLYGTTVHPGTTTEQVDENLDITISKYAGNEPEFTRIEDEKIIAHIQDLMIEIDNIDNERKMRKALELLSGLKNMDPNTSPEASVEDILPQFPGGITAWTNYMRENLKYPARAAKKGIEGRVMVEFIVTRTGKVKNVKVIKGLCNACDAESKRVITNSPDWIPGKSRGVTADLKLIIPISFKLAKPNN